MIQLSRPLTDDSEINNVLDVFKSGMLANGQWVSRFEAGFGDYIGTRYAVATSNGTVALDIALKALDIKKGDEVIVPDFTFIATANSVLFQNARPVFADIDDKSFNIDPEDVLCKITSKTKAIVGVHLFGHPFDVNAIKEICEDHGLYMIEDCAQAHGSKYRGQVAGSFGDLGCFSFYATKNMTTGEGGMVTTSDEALKDRLSLIINHGQSRKYMHTSLGYNYRMTNIQAAIGLAQLGKLEGFNDARIKNAGYLSSHLNVKGIVTPFKDDNVKHVYHQYVVKVEESFPLSRPMLMDYLSKNGIASAVHYPYPVHMQPLYKELGYDEDQCRVSSQASKAVLSLPVSPASDTEDMKHICEQINILGE